MSVNNLTTETWQVPPREDDPYAPIELAYCSRTDFDEGNAAEDLSPGYLVKWATTDRSVTKTTDSDTAHAGIVRFDKRGAGIMEPSDDVIHTGNVVPILRTTPGVKAYVKVYLSTSETLEPGEELTYGVAGHLQKKAASQDYGTEGGTITFPKDLARSLERKTSDTESTQSIWVAVVFV